MKNNNKIVKGVSNGKQIATHSFAMTSLVENIIKFERGVSSSKQITTSFLLPPPLRCGGHGAMTSLVENRETL